MTRTDDGLLYDTFYNKYNGGAWNSNLTRLASPHSPLFQLVVDEDKLRYKGADGAASQTRSYCATAGLSNFSNDSVSG